MPFVWSLLVTTGYKSQTRVAQRHAPVSPAPKSRWLIDQATMSYSADEAEDEKPPGRAKRNSKNEREREIARDSETESESER